MSIVEAAEAARAAELNRLKERNPILEDEKSILDGRVAALESAAMSKESELV
ncbi:hypothetical protein Tco_0607431, partial [Tanacetum coccineum]